MTAQVGQLIDLNTNVLTVAQAITNLTALLSPTSSPAAIPVAIVATSSTAATTAANDNSADVLAALNALNDRLDALIAQNGAIAMEQISALQVQADLLARQIRAAEA